MIVEILVEEPSAKAALDQLVPRIAPHVAFTVHPHQGKPDLLAKLPGRLRGYAAMAEAVDLLVVVLVDRDREDCRRLRQSIVAAGRNAKLSERLLARIAIEELEAWFFGDVPALRRAFPGVPATLDRRRTFRDPDAVSGGTAEALFRVLAEAGHEGIGKTELARTMGGAMDVDANRSRSFQVFRDGLRRCLGVR